MLRPIIQPMPEGTLRYQNGVWALRDQTVGEKWSVHRENSVEAIRNDKLKVKEAFSNVDIAATMNRSLSHARPRGLAPNTFVAAIIWLSSQIRSTPVWRVGYLLPHGR